MQNLTLTPEEIVIKVGGPFVTDEMLSSLAAVFPIWKLLAEGSPVSSDLLATTLGKEPEEVDADLQKVKRTGFVTNDEDGNIDSFFGLHLNPTDYRMQIGDESLYAG